MNWRMRRTRFTRNSLMHYPPATSRSSRPTNPRGRGCRSAQMKKRPAVPPPQLGLFDDWLVAPQPTDNEQPGRFSSTTSPPPIDSPPSPMAPEPGPLSMDESRHLLAQRLATKLNADGEITSSFLFETANHAFGGTQAAGTYSSKDAYDAMEAAFNLHLLAIERKDWSEQQGPEWAARKIH